MGIVGSVLGLIALAFIVLVPLCKIMHRAGLNPYLSLIIFIPGLGYLIVIGILAFAQWPTEPDGYR